MSFDALNELIAPLIAFVASMTALVGVVAYLKKNMNQGMATKTELSEGLESVKKSNQNYTDIKLEDLDKDLDEKDSANKKWLGTIQDKLETAKEDIKGLETAIDFLKK